MEEVERVNATPAALEVITKLKERFGPLMFHQSGGCCDGSQPMCFEDGEFKIGQSDILIGEIGDSPFYMARDQYHINTGNIHT